MIHCELTCQDTQCCVFCSSFHDGFPENWAALRDSWALLVEKQKVSMNKKESSDQVQHLGGFSSSQEDPQSGKLLEHLVDVDPKMQEYFPPSLLKEETTETVEVGTGMAIDLSGGRFVVLENQLEQATTAEEHFELERYLASTPLQKMEEKSVMDTTYGRLLEVKDEVMLDCLDFKPFAEETVVIKEDLDTEEISDCHANTVRKNIKVPNSVKGSVNQTVANFDIGQDLVAKDEENGVQMFEVKKKEKNKIGVKKSKGGSKVKELVPNCEECGKTFSRYSKRLLHINVVHRKIMPVKCEIFGCDKGFASKRDKEEHIRVEHNHIPFTCPMENCAKNFTSKTNCTAHVRMVHLKHRPYVCPYPECGVQVTRKFALEYHKRAVHGEPKLGCPVQGCDREFNLGWQLAVHVKNYHSAAV